MTSPPNRLYQIGACVLLALWIGLTLYQSLSLTDGILIYALDDPYIHLAVAETILEGGYGVNTGEYASPSSSILYPFLLAGTTLLGLGTWGPLALNVLPMLIVCWILSGMIWQYSVPPGNRTAARFAVIAIPVVLFVANMVALPFTGMEHPLHILATVLVVLGLLRLGEDGRVRWYLPLGMVLAPLMRFEGLALFGAAFLVLLILRRWRPALVSGGIVAAVLAVYVATMTRLGLPPLPSSVLTKSTVSEAATSGSFSSILQQVVARLETALSNPAAILLLLGAITLVASLAIGGNRRKHWPATVAVILAVLGHLMAGRYGWFGRYEIYLNAAVLAACVAAWSDALLRGGTFVRAAGLLLFAAMAVSSAAIYIVTVPGTKNLYGQQYQMHRFLTEFFPQPVAVNDLGYTSYRNPNHVLDLFGLGSETARKLRVGKELTPDDLRQLTSDAETVFAMIYTYWLTNGLPQEWCLAATMTTVPRVTASHEHVDFYLIEMSMEDEMRRALTALGTDLPNGTTMVQTPCN